MELNAALNSQVVQLKLLLSLLNEERRELSRSAPDGDVLLRIAEKKQQHLNAIAELNDNGRSSALNGDPGLLTDKRNISALNAVKEIAAKVFRANQANGVLVSSRMTMNQRILNFIRETRGVTMYGADGKAAAGRALHSSKA